MQIQKANLKFNGTLTKRGRTDGILLHHAAGLGSVEAIHNYHKNTNKWAGIGYNFYIRLDGSIWEGRGWDAVGAHAGASSGYNGKTIGICFEGNYSELTSMPAAQFNAGVWLIKEAFKRYGKILVWGHKDVYATACPGRNFPLNKFKAVTLESEVEEVPEWMQKIMDEAKSIGLISGDHNPNDTATKWFVLGVILNAIKYIKGGK